MKPLIRITNSKQWGFRHK